MDHPTGTERNLAQRLGGADGERLEEILGGTHVRDPIQRRSLQKSVSLADTWGMQESPRHDDLTAEQVRVLGCLVEKESTVPDTYPLTLNSLRTACNQSTSRDPVVSYADHDVDRALGSLRERGLVLKIGGTKAAKGTLRLSRNRVTGTLDGRKISSRVRRTQALATAARALPH